MADENTSTSVKTGETATIQAEKVESTEVKPITLADVEALIKKAINPLFASKRVAEKETTTEKPTTKETKSEAETSIQARLQTLENERSKLNQSRQRDAIDRAALEEGVPKEHLKKFRTLFESEFGSKLEVTDDGVVYREFSEDTPKTIEFLVKDYLKGEGEFFRPAIQTPGSKGIRSSGSATRTLGSEKSVYEMSIDERLKLTPAQLASKLRAQ